MDVVLLLCVCVLTLSTTSGSVVTVGVQERSDAILPCSLSPRQNIAGMVFDWKKDDLEVFLYDAGLHYNKGRTGQSPQFKGRVFHFEEELKLGNASIKIRNTQQADSGNYSCEFPGGQRSYVRLVVGAAPEPYITTLTETKDGVLLQCDVRGAFPKPEVVWKNSSGNMVPSEDPQVSEREGRFYITLQTTVTKADHYHCVATQEEIKHQIHSETYVPIGGAASEPHVTIMKQTKNWAMLQCVVRGASPKPRVLWKDRSGKLVPAGEPEVTERGGSYDIILQTTVTTSGFYLCEAAQDQINHQTSNQIYVYISEFPTGWIIGSILGTLFVVGVVIVILVAKGCISCKKDGAAELQHKDSENPLNQQEGV